MSEFKKALKIIGGENIEIKSGAENNINPLAIQNYYDVRKVDIDLNNGETTTFNPFDYMNVGDRLTIHAGVLYHGKVTEIEKDGFWLTEDYETEEYISFVDVKEIKIHDF